MIYILGAGALGCLWAARLHRQEPLCFLSTRAYATRKKWFPNSDSVNQRFSQLPPLPDRCFDYLPAAIQGAAIEAVKIPQQLSDHSLRRGALLLVTTKSYDVVPSLSEWIPKLDSSHRVLLFQNGMGSQQAACELLGKVPCFAAVTTEAANLEPPSRVVHAATGVTRIGPLNEAAREIEQEDQTGFLDTLSLSGLKISATKDIWKTLWLKLAINCAINPFTAIAQCRNGEVSSTTLFKQLWPALSIELMNMLTTAGLDCTPDELDAMVFKVMHDTRDNLSSMLQDRMAKRQTEIDFINGFAARYLSTHGHSNDANRKLTELVYALGD
ncbi:MAG: hypothetical protein C9356_06265 [Oleiphilus sp.]|nr:MAG: hypothetical protein C9356_06265 [Oleiphilus sp.]